jgi:signal transduction histidine kinase
MQDKTEKEKNYRLERFYSAVNTTTLIVLPIFAFIIYINKETFLWVTHPELNFWAFISITIWDAFFIYLRDKTRKKVFYDIGNYGFIVFFFIGIYTTGGVNSAFVMALLFPLLIAATDLDEKSVKVRGVIITILYALLILVNPEFWNSGSIITRHFLQVILYGLMAFYVYKMVKETLRQRYERDEVEKRFVHMIELDKLKSSFVNVASHQLRTPLTGAKWAIESVSGSNSLSPSERNILNEAKEKIEKSIDIVGKILKTAETDSNDFSAKLKELCTPISMMHEIIEDLSFLAEKKKVKIIFHSNGEGTVVCDKSALKAALINIVDNAIRYSRLNGEVSVSVMDMEDKSIITIKDNGIGISDEDQMFLFERFFRGKNAISTDPNEAGIGLYISKNIIEFHGGNISLASKLNQGTIVTITLPLKKLS